jgi:hypothetical protein
LLHSLPANSVLHQPAKDLFVREGHHMIATINIRVKKTAKRTEKEGKMSREMRSESILVTSCHFLIFVLRLRIRGAMPFHSHTSLQCLQHGDNFTSYLCCLDYVLITR